MNRRDALKSLTALAGATGLTVTPVTEQHADGVELVILKVKGRCSCDTMDRIRAYWSAAVEGTSLAKTKTVVFDENVDLELIRSSSSVFRR